MLGSLIDISRKLPDGRSLTVRGFFVDGRPGPTAVTFTLEGCTLTRRFADPAAVFAAVDRVTADPAAIVYLESTTTEEVR